MEFVGQGNRCYGLVKLQRLCSVETVELDYLDAISPSQGIQKFNVKHCVTGVKQEY